MLLDIFSFRVLVRVLSSLVLNLLTDRWHFIPLWVEIFSKNEIERLQEQQACPDALTSPHLRRALRSSPSCFAAQYSSSGNVQSLNVQIASLPWIVAAKWIGCLRCPLFRVLPAWHLQENRGQGVWMRKHNALFAQHLMETGEWRSRWCACACGRYSSNAGGLSSPREF